MHPDPSQLIELRDLDELARAQDADPVAHVLDLGQYVGGKKDSGAVIARVAEQRVELALVERVEPAGGLIKDQQVWPVHEREQDRELLLVAAGVLAIPAIQVEVESLRDRAHLTAVHAASHAAQVSHDLGAAKAAELGHIAG